MNRLPSRALAALLLSAAVGAASAATAPEPSAQKVIDEVRALAAKARRDRGADPWLLQSMEALVAKYDQPWGAPVVDEAFRDGDITRNPAWNVVSGRFWVDASLGLRSQSDARPAESEAASDADPNQNWGNVLMGMFLSGMAQQQQGARPAPQSTVQPAVITLPVTVSNAFALDFAFSQHRPPGEASRMEIGMLDGARDARGYSLALRSGTSAYATLKRVEGARSVVLQRVPLGSSFATGAVQTVRWRRGLDGQMVVTINDKAVLNVLDRGPATSWQRLGISNRGGDYAVRRVTLAGART